MPRCLMDSPEAVTSGKVLIVEGSVPAYAREGDAGLDLIASEDADIGPMGGTALVGTGTKVVLPESTFGAVCPRSGLASKGVTVMNAPGVIDSGYRGEVKVLLVNHSKEVFFIKKGMRIAQLVVLPFIRCYVVEGEVSSHASSRGDGGFGSTGS